MVVSPLFKIENISSWVVCGWSTKSVSVSLDKNVCVPWMLEYVCVPWMLEYGSGVMNMPETKKQL